MISGPSFMKYVYESDDLNRTDVMKLSVDWTPKPPDQKADFQFCVWGVDNMGYLLMISVYLFKKKCCFILSPLEQFYKYIMLHCNYMLFK